MFLCGDTHEDGWWLSQPSSTQVCIRALQKRLWVLHTCTSYGSSPIPAKLTFTLLTDPLQRGVLVELDQLQPVLLKALIQTRQRAVFFLLPGPTQV